MSIPHAKKDRSDELIQGRMFHYPSRCLAMKTSLLQPGSIHVNPYGDIHVLLNNTSFIVYVEVDGIQR